MQILCTLFRICARTVFLHRLIQYYHKTSKLSRRLRCGCYTPSLSYQGHSRAGRGPGLNDHRSKPFFDLVRVMNVVQSTISPDVDYILENVVSRVNRRENVRFLGPKVATYAATLNSHARRLRAKWTNMVNLRDLRRAIEHTERSKPYTFQDCLGPH